MKVLESVTSHGPFDGKRHAELTKLFAGSTAGLVYVTAFPTRAIIGPVFGRDCMGNGSVGCLCAVALDPFQWRAVLDPYVTTD